MSDEVHYLDEYLTEILPQLGLDVETYGPYVTGYANEDEDTDDGMDDLIELLRASSESHGDDDASWTKFRNDIKRIRKEFLDGEDNRKEQIAIKMQQEQSTSLRKEIELAQKNEELLETRKQQELEGRKVENMSADRIALMAKFGYEQDDDCDEDDEEEGDKPKTNREYAAQQHLKNSRELRKGSIQTKKDAQTETKKAKELLATKKEERRKRATKGERKR